MYTCSVVKGGKVTDVELSVEPLAGMAVSVDGQECVVRAAFHLMDDRHVAAIVNESTESDVDLLITRFSSALPGAQQSGLPEQVRDLYTRWLTNMVSEPPVAKRDGAILEHVRSVRSTSSAM